MAGMSSGVAVAGAEQVDGLVAVLAGLDAGRDVIRPALGRVARRLRRGGRGGVDRPAARGLERALEHAQQALPARVDDVRLAQDRQQRGRLGDGPLGGIDRGGEHRLDVVVALRGGDRGGRRLADDGEDRALDRLRDRLVGRLRARVERMGEVEAVEPLLALQALRDAGQDLARDDARVAAGAHQRPEARRVGDAVGVGVGPGLVGLLERGPDGGQHVRAGVAVGHREHVERVDLVDVRLEGRDGAPEGGQEAGPVARAARHQATSVPLAARSDGRGSPETG